MEGTSEPIVVQFSWTTGPRVMTMSAGGWRDTNDSQVSKTQTISKMKKLPPQTVVILLRFTMQTILGAVHQHSDTKMWNHPLLMVSTPLPPFC